MATGLFGNRFALGLDGDFFAFEISHAAFAFDRFVVLFAHISLYFAFVFRFCVVTMVSHALRFNIFLLLLITLGALTGCQTPEAKHAKQRAKQLATLRVHLEMNPGPPGRDRQITVLRTAPMKLMIERDPFLTEVRVESAKLVEAPAGFTIAIQFDTKGMRLLEMYVAANPQKRLAIWSQFGVEPDIKDRWLAAPLPTKTPKDGILTFTPDASRDEAQQIVIGLNNFAGAPPVPEKQESPAK